MRAAWYERQGRPDEVFRLGDLPTPVPDEGEVRVRLTRSGVNPGEIKKRQGWLGSAMPYPLVVPHSDGAGRIDAVGPGVDASRVGQRVWVHGAQSYRQFGTAAEATVVPQWMAVPLPDSVSDETGACLGIPGITAHRAVFADGPVAGQTVLVHGVLGAVGSIAAQLAAAAEATVIGTVRSAADLEEVPASVTHPVTLDDPDPAAWIRALAPGGVDRVIEVAFSSNVDLDAAVVGVGAVIAAYSSPDERPEIPFWELLFNDVTVRLLGSDDFPHPVKEEAARELTEAAASGALTVRVAGTYPLDEIATAHSVVENERPTGRIILTIP